MRQKHATQMTPNEAFDAGVQSAKKQHNKLSNPFRNMDMYDIQHEQWNCGWLSIIKGEQRVQSKQSKE